MAKPLQPTATVNCVCGQVVVEAIGAPIASVVCYCDDCQEGARQIRSLPNAVSIGGRTIPTDVPQYSRYPLALLVKLVLAKAAMLLRS